MNIDYNIRSIPDILSKIAKPTYRSQHYLGQNIWDILLIVVWSRTPNIISNYKVHKIQLSNLNTTF